MVHPVGVIHYDTFWLYAAGFFAVVCAFSCAWWCKWVIEYLMCYPREYLARGIWMLARQHMKGKVRWYWEWMVVTAFGSVVCLALYIFQH